MPRARPRGEVARVDSFAPGRVRDGQLRQVNTFDQFNPVFTKSIKEFQARKVLPILSFLVLSRKGCGGYDPTP